MSFGDAVISGRLGSAFRPTSEERLDPPATVELAATPNARVLLVEDEQPFRELLQDFPVSQGYRVHAVPDGRCGARWLETHAADLVLTDLCMPELDGMELLMTIRKLHPMTPVIVMSGGVGGALIGMLRAAELLGARRTLEKPFSLYQLASAVRETLNSR